MEMTLHEKLVRKARAWLLLRHGCVISEMATTGEEPDAIGFSKFTTLVECKASRADFLSDAGKPFRLFPEQGMGDLRYYLAPPGIIKRTELPAGWGLLELHDEKVYKIANAAYQQRKNHRAEAALLVSALRRVDGDVQGVSVKHYVYTSQNRAVVLTMREPDDAEALAPQQPKI
jgi:hypothetical protein